MLQRVKYILDTTKLEEEIRELKLSVHNDTLSKLRIITDNEHTIIELYTDNLITGSRDIFYGREINGRLYIGRHQHIASIDYDPIDVYAEFYSNGIDIYV